MARGGRVHEVGTGDEHVHPVWIAGRGAVERHRHQLVHGLAPGGHGRRLMALAHAHQPVVVEPRGLAPAQPARHGGLGGDRCRLAARVHPVQPLVGPLGEHQPPASHRPRAAAVLEHPGAGVPGPAASDRRIDRGEEVVDGPVGPPAHELGASPLGRALLAPPHIRAVGAHLPHRGRAGDQPVRRERRGPRPVRDGGTGGRGCRHGPEPSTPRQRANGRRTTVRRYRASRSAMRWMPSPRSSSPKANDSRA